MFVAILVEERSSFWGNWFQDVSEELNPYTPPESQLERHDVLTDHGVPQKNMKPPSLRRAAIRWFFICSVSAVPSFLLGSDVSKGQFGAMVLGVLIFASGYTMLDYQTALTDIRQNRLISITLRIVYATRLLITLFFPIGMGIDMLCGLLSVSCTQGLFGGQAVETFPGALFTTLIQGAVLNLVLAIYGTLVAGLVTLFVSRARSRRTSISGPSNG